MVAQRVISRIDTLLDKQLTDQPLPGNGTVGAQQQQREKRTLLRPSDRDRGALHRDRERTKDSELEAAVCHRVRVSPFSGRRARGRDTFGTALGHEQATIP